MEVVRESTTANPAGSPKFIGATPSTDDKTPFRNFEGLATKLLKVPKGEVDEKLAERKETRKRKQD